jgi:hypothetical protein
MPPDPDGSRGRSWAAYLLVVTEPLPTICVFNLVGFAPLL